MNEHDFSKIFKAHKLEFSDKDFSEHILKRLPERKSILPQMVMVLSVVLGLTLMLAIQGFTPIMEQLVSLVGSISQLQMPSASAITTYLGVLGLSGLIGFSLAYAD